MTAIRKKLTPEEMAAISSPYLSEGRKRESWEISDVEIDGPVLTAKVRMAAGYASPTDAGRAHLTIFSTLEFLSQLGIIYMHVWNGYARKTREVWMVDCSVSSREPIRNTEDVRVRVEVPSIRRIRDTTVIRMKCQVTDGDGLFEAKLKAVMT